MGDSARDLITVRKKDSRESSTWIFLYRATDGLDKKAVETSYNPHPQSNPTDLLLLLLLDNQKIRSNNWSENHGFTSQDTKMNLFVGGATLCVGGAGLCD
jgi:hypothetical protein